MKGSLSFDSTECDIEAVDVKGERTKFLKKCLCAILHRDGGVYRRHQHPKKVVPCATKKKNGKKCHLRQCYGHYLSLQADIKCRSGFDKEISRFKAFGSPVDEIDRSLSSIVLSSRLSLYSGQVSVFKK